MSLLVALAWAVGAGVLGVVTTPWARRHEARYERLRESLLDVPGSYPILAALLVFLAACAGDGPGR